MELNALQNNYQAAPSNINALSTYDWKKEYEDFKKSDWKPTTLPPEEEAQFKDYIVNTKWWKQIKNKISKEMNKVVDDTSLMDLLKINSNDSQYDYRGAWKAGLAPKDYAPDPSSQHWVSSTPEGKLLKSPNHPTTWMEFFMRQYKKDPMELGIKTYEDALNMENQPKK